MKDFDEVATVERSRLRFDQFAQDAPVDGTPFDLTSQRASMNDIDSNQDPSARSICIVPEKKLSSPGTVFLGDAAHGLMRRCED